MKTKNQNIHSDSSNITRPSRTYRGQPDFEPIPLKRKHGFSHPLWWLAAGILLLILYFFFPEKKTVLVLGIDRSIENTAIGRSDTNILLSVNTFSAQVNAVSIPRDLWVVIPNHGENRINAAHAFGEAEKPSSGPLLSMATLEHNFGIRADYFIRFQLEKFPAMVDALGGVEIQLDEAIGGYPPGTSHLDGQAALAFVRDRSEGDDFFRMLHGQIFVKAFLQKLLQPASWLRFPELLTAAAQAVDTNLPVWQQPRLLVALLRSSQGTIEFLTIDREMVTPWVTPGGAQVLLPRWEALLPLLQEEFGASNEN